MTESACRRIVALRSGGVCECCGMRRGQSMSHRKPRGQGGSWSPANIMHACGDGVAGCHGWIEHNPRAAHEHGWRLWRYEDPEKVPAVVRGRPMVLSKDGGLSLPKSSELTTGVADTGAPERAH